LKHLKGVHTINLSYCNQITDEDLEHLKGVRTINLGYCYQITDEGFQLLKDANPNLIR
jgi:hypothetical protein